MEGYGRSYLYEGYCIMEMGWICVALLIICGYPFLAVMLALCVLVYEN
jgi:hypothetical protein